MSGGNGERGVKKRRWWKSGMAGVWAIALGTVAVHVATGWRYGFNRDELMLLEDARHLAWGYVQYPPMTAFFGWMALKLFGTSLVGFRFFAAVVQALALVLTGLMAKEIAGNIENRRDEIRNSKSESRDALGDSGRQVIAKEHSQEWLCHGDWAAMAAAGAGVPFCLGGGALMQYISFDYVCWVLVAYGMVRVLNPAARSGKDTRDPGPKHKPGTPIREEELNSTKVERWNSRDEEGHAKSEDRDASENEDGRVKRPLQPGEVRGGESIARNGGARWWVVVGLGIGLGMMVKWTMGFLVVGVVVGVLATEARRFLRSGWLWLGVLVAVAVWAPNVWWQWERGFPSLEFLRFLHTRDVGEGLTDWFLVGQLELTLLGFPLAVAGVWFYFFAEEGKPYRAVGWMYAAALVLFLVMRGRDYYLAPAYPMLYAAGAVWMEEQWPVASDEWREKISAKVQGYKGPRVRFARWSRRWLPAVLVVDAVVAGCVALPIMPVNSWWWKKAALVDVVLPEELGWEELAETVAKVRDGLPERERARLGILARNYGEMGALNLYGEGHGLPRAISGVNSSWERGYGNPAPETVIAVGYTREFLEGHFASCELVAHTGNRFGVANEETIEDPDIFVCRGLKESWEEFWKKVKLFA